MFKIKLNLKIRIGPHIVIQCDNYIVLSASSDSSDLPHTLEGEKKHLRGRMAAKQGQLWITLVKQC